MKDQTLVSLPGRLTSTAWPSVTRASVPTPRADVQPLARDRAAVTGYLVMLVAVLLVLTAVAALWGIS